jgi:hypothetical protein
VKHIAHIAGDFLRFLLRLVHLGAEIQHDTDFLGYEAYSSLNMVTSKGLSQGKVAVIDKKAGSAGSSKESLPLKAA